MQAKWLNEKQPDENGDITAVVENSSGQTISIFKGKTIDEVADKLLVGQTQANREISRLFKKLQPDKGRKPLKVQTRVLTADDKFRLASEMSDPEKVVGAVQEIVNTTAKVPLEELATRSIEDDQKQTEEFIKAEAIAFRDDTPEYMPSDKNFAALTDELKAHGWDFTRNNLTIAYRTLMEREELEQWPVEGATPLATEPDREGGSNSGNSAPAEAPAPLPNGKPEPLPPSPRPRSISTGIRNTDASALPPPPTRKKQYTRADIELMSRAEYIRRLHEEPGFRQQVDAMGS